MVIFEALDLYHRSRFRSYGPVATITARLCQLLSMELILIFTAVFILRLGDFGARRRKPISNFYFQKQTKVCASSKILFCALFAAFCNSLLKRKLMMRRFCVHFKIIHILTPLFLVYPWLPIPDVILTYSCLPASEHQVGRRLTTK